MKITFLGTGTSQGVPIIGCDCLVCQSENNADKRLRTSVLVQANNKNIVVDSGPDFRQQMLACKLNRLDGLIFTHAHKDHIAGLDDIRGFNYVQQEAIDVYCTQEVEQQIRKEFSYIFDDVKYPGVPELTIARIYNDVQFDVKGVLVTPIEVKHYRLPVLGFKFTETNNKNTFAYITDANFIAQDEIQKMMGCHTLVLNALRHEKHISHFTLNEALAMIEKIKPKRAYLTHISHQLGLHNKVTATLPENVFLAYDGLTIEM
ncbi:MAG: MBL fold metallo-hydrolase [Bacteroidia bacterium]|nr:MBL fold metallo-hydrolase [Bacteroidia bacterium]